jgi:enoyl-CoA hydratase/carnithine racemase
MLDLGENENRFTPRFLTEIDQALDSITGSSEPAALDVMTTGWRYDAPDAREAGIVDAICDAENLLHVARRMVVDLANKDCQTLGKIKSTVYARVGSDLVEPLS